MTTEVLEMSITRSFKIVSNKISHSYYFIILRKESDKDARKLAQVNLYFQVISSQPTYKHHMTLLPCQLNYPANQITISRQALISCNRVIDLLS